MTLFADLGAFSAVAERTYLRLSPRRRRWLVLALLLGLAALLVSACAVPNGSATPLPPGATPTPPPSRLEPAHPGADPIGLLAWLFTPLFQALFMIMAGIYALTGNVGIAIVVLTLLIRALTIPFFRQQIVSTRRMQMLQPELREIQRRYKGDRQKASEAQMALYKERGVNPAAGCLPTILQMFLLLPMYTVIRDGLTNWDPTAMLKVGSFTVVHLNCQNVVNGVADKALPCINTHLPLIGDIGKANLIEIPGTALGVGGLALVAAFLQLIQSRMVMPPASADSDPSAGMQRQMMYLLPLMTLLWSSLPAGLFIYWIVTTIFSIVQQYLIVGWGSMFPLFSWNPAFAQNHTPRFPVAMPAPEGAGRSVAVTHRTSDDRAASAAATVRPNPQRGRQGRRGRRR